MSRLDPRIILIIFGFSLIAFSCGACLIGTIATVAQSQSGSPEITRVIVTEVVITKVTGKKQKSTPLPTYTIYPTNTFYPTYTPGDSQPPVVVTATVPPTKETVLHSVGEEIPLTGGSIVLNSADFNNDLLKLNYTIKNTGTENIVISTASNFSARKPDGTVVEQILTGCGTGLDSTVLPGDILKGDLCYKGPFDGAVKIYYASSLVGTTTVIWKVAP